MTAIHSTPEAIAEQRRIKEGYDARLRGVLITACPYQHDEWLDAAWISGWISGWNAADRPVNE